MFLPEYAADNHEFNMAFLANLPEPPELTEMGDLEEFESDEELDIFELAHEKMKFNLALIERGLKEPDIEDQREVPYWARSWPDENDIWRIRKKEDGIERGICKAF